MKSAITGDVGNCLHFVRSPFGAPGYFAVAVVDVHAGNVHAFNLAPLGQHRIFGDKVSDHEKAAASAVERSEKSGSHPVEQFRNTGGTFHQLVVVEVVDYDIIGAVRAVAQTARGLTATAGKKRDIGLGDKFAVLPVAGVVLFAEIGNITLVVL